MSFQTALLDALFEHTDDYIALIGNETILRINGALATLMGRSPTELEGSPVMSLIAPEDRELAATIIQSVRDGQPSARRVIRLVSADGSHHPVEWNLRLLPDGEQSLILALGASATGALQLKESLDAAQRELATLSAEVERLKHELEEKTLALAAAERDLQTLDSLKANLVSTISHELRTPLVSVRGYADMLSGGRLGPLSETQQQAADVMLRNVDRLMEIIENVLTYSALENQDASFQPQSVNLNLALTSVVRHHHAAAAQRDVTLDLDFGGQVFEIVADPQHLSTLFTQLITNAIKFNTAGGRVSIMVSRVEGGVEIRIGDTGIGIAPERLQKIFERFYQVDSSRTRRYGGLGLGLAIARRIVLIHGGTIEVQSRQGEGTIFVIRLPENPGKSP